MGPKNSQKIGKFKFKDLFHQTLESGCWGSCDLCSPSDRILGIFLSMLRFGLNLWNSVVLVTSCLTFSLPMPEIPNM